MRKKFILNNLFEYVLSFCIILQCNSLIMANSGTLKSIFNLITLMLISFLFIMSIYRIHCSHKEKNDNKKIKMFSLFLFLYSFDLVVIEYFFVDKFNVLTIFFFLISPIAFVTYLYERKINAKLDYSIFRKIVLVIFILEIISLIGWVLILMGIQPNITFFSQWSKQNVSGYFYLDFITQHNSFLGIDNVVRNTGLFTEAPMYSYVLCISLIIQTFIKVGKFSRFDKINYLVTLITIFSTLSTTGIIISIIIVMIDVLQFVLTKYDDKIKKFIVPFLIFIGMASSLLVFLNKGKSSPGSYSSMIRSDDIHSCIRAWMDHIFWGVGINNTDYISQYALPFRLHNLSLSTGFFSVLAFGGMALTLFYIVPLFLSIFKSKKVFIMSTILLILFVYTIIPFAYLFSLLLSYLWFEFLFCKKGESVYELFSSWIGTVWSNICSRSSKKG